jgi:hypothetical protein
MAWSTPYAPIMRNGMRGEFVVAATWLLFGYCCEGWHSRQREIFYLYSLLSDVVQCIYMNNTMPIGMKSELDEIKSEVRSLHITMENLLKLTTRLLTRLEGIDGIDYSDVTPDELMIEASWVFRVTSKYDPDDDLIVPDAAIKPVDWSGYA